MTSSYTACAGSSIVGNDTSLNYKGHTYNVQIRSGGSKPVIQADPSFHGDLLILGGGDANHNQLIKGIKLINDPAYHTIALNNSILIPFKDYHNIILSNLESDGRITISLPLTNNVNVSFNDITAYVSGNNPVTQSTTVYDKQNNSYQYASGVIELIGNGVFQKGKWGLLTVSDFKNVNISNGSPMGYSGILISGQNQIYDDHITINTNIDFSKQSISLQKNGSYTPVLLFLGKNVESSYDIVLPDTINLTNALGVVNHISLTGDISFNKEAPDTIKLTNSTLIDNHGNIGSVHLAGDYTLSNSTILGNDNGSVIGNYAQSGRVTLTSGGDVLNNDGTITTMDISDLTATNSSGSTVVYIRNQNGAKITNLNLSGTITMSDNWAFVYNESDGTITNITQDGTFNMGNGYVINNHTDTSSTYGIGDITFNGDINFTGAGQGMLLYNNGNINSLSTKGIVNVANEISSQDYIVYNDTAGFIQNVDLANVTDKGGLVNIIYNASVGGTGGNVGIKDITISKMTTTSDTLTFINNTNNGIIDNITLDVTNIANEANTIYVDNTNGVIKGTISGIYNITGTDPVFALPVISSSKFKNGIFSGFHIKAKDIILIKPVDLIHLTSSVGSSVLDITADNVNYTGAGDLSKTPQLVVIDKGVSINSVSINNVKNFSTIIRNTGTITDSATISNSKIMHDDSGSQNTYIYGIYNIGTIGTATIDNNSTIMNDGYSYAFVYGIYNHNGGSIGSATISNSKIMHTDTGSRNAYIYGIFNYEGSIGTATISNSTITNDANANANAYVTGIYNGAAMGKHGIIGTATISHSKIENNSVGIGNTGTITNAIITSNSTITANGEDRYVYGIHSSGTITNATISNSTITGDGVGYVYGIFNEGTMTSATVSHSTITNNSVGIQADGSGTISTATISNSKINGSYGIYDYDGIIIKAIISNSTITSNNANSYAYGIYNGVDGSLTGSATISNSTIINTAGYAYGIGNFGLMNTAIIKDSTFDGGGGQVCGYYKGNGSQLTNPIQSSGNTFTNGAVLSCNG